MTDVSQLTAGVFAGFIIGVVASLLGVAGGELLIPTLVLLHQVVPVGILFAVSMMLGIALTLGTVALASVLFRKQVAHLLERRPQLFAIMSKTLEVLAGLLLIAVAAAELLKWS